MDQFFPIRGVAEKRFPKGFSFAIDAGVGCDTIEPGKERRVRLEFWEGLKGFQEYILCGVLGVLRISEHMAAEVVNFVLVPDDDLSERGRVAILEPVNEVDVSRTVHDHIIQKYCSDGKVNDRLESH